MLDPLCPIWFITNAGDPPASQSTEQNVRRSEWFVTCAIDGIPRSSRFTFAALTAFARIRLPTSASSRPAQGR